MIECVAAFLVSGLVLGAAALIAFWPEGRR